MYLLNLGELVYRKVQCQNKENYEHHGRHYDTTLPIGCHYDTTLPIGCHYDMTLPIGRHYDMTLPIGCHYDMTFPIGCLAFRVCAIPIVVCPLFITTNKAAKLFSIPLNIYLL